MLPPETLEVIFGHLERGDLFSLLSISSVFHQAAARVLYRALTDLPAKRALRLVKTLARNDFYPPLVRRLDLEWIDNTLTANFLRLLHHALRRLSRLSYLGLEFSPADNAADLAWILHGCTFSLRVFTTSLRCDAPLARFLATQPALVEVCLRGAGLDPTPAHAHAIPSPFPLPASALPHLSHFRTALPAPHLTAAFLRGRPVECVSLPLHTSSTTASLDALLLSARPVRRLTVMSESPDAPAPAGLVAAIAARLPALEALHALVLARRSSQEELIEAAPALSRFTALRYLTFVGPGVLDAEHEHEHEHEHEAEIAAAWGRACPTLRTIILPRGVMWGCVDGRWVSVYGVS